METLKNPTEGQNQFYSDMTKAGYEVEVYHGSGGRQTYAVACYTVRNRYSENLPDAQDVIRATKVRIVWDGLGGNDIVLAPYA